MPSTSINSRRMVYLNIKAKSKASKLNYFRKSSMTLVNRAEGRSTYVLGSKNIEALKKWLNLL